MRISLSWLKEYVTINVPTEELAHSLTMRGLEVEGVEYQGAKYDKFVVGRVREAIKHPKADKLTICKVDIGEAVIQIVCGAPNVKEGLLVPVGLAGATVPRNQHDPDGKPLILSKVSLRGVESNGMICSEYELDLGPDKEGILIFKTDAPPGTPLAKYLNLDDVIFEIGITPNRPDAMSHIGIAREVASILGVKLNLPGIKLSEGERKISEHASVVIKDSMNCPRYSARLLFDLKVAKSPQWLELRLLAVGIRPVNNVVDVTNYVLMECGHPLHAFDYDALEKGTVIIKSGLGGVRFNTLDHKERKLLPDTLMICDDKKPLAIAGVMGGEESEIKESTSKVFIESAYFSPGSIRKTAKYFGLSSDASQRFERGTDPNGTVWALERAADLIRSVAGGELLQGIIDIYPSRIREREISLRLSKVNELLGITVTSKEVISLLSEISLQCVKVQEEGKDITLNFSVPTFRPDIEREIDLIEEIARTFGYDKIPVMEESKIKLSRSFPQNDFISEIRSYFIGAGLNEIVTNSMQQAQIAAISSPDAVKIANPISREMEALRTSLLPNMLEVIRDNIFHGNNSLRLFEIGKSYIHLRSPNEAPIPGYSEKSILMISMVGPDKPLSWGEKQRNIDIYDLKGLLETFFEKIFLDNIKFIHYPNTNALSDRGIRIEINNEYAGQLGYVRKDLLSRFEIENDVTFAEIEIQMIEKYLGGKRYFKPLPKYPPVIRDLAFVVGSEIKTSSLIDTIREADAPMLNRIDLFDTYFGEQIGENKKSYAFRLEFISPDHTMTQLEIEGVMSKIIKALEMKLKAVVRT